MRSRTIRYWLSFFFTFVPFFILTSPAVAQQTAAITPEYQNRAAELLLILKGSEQEEQFFAISFLEAVPLTQFRALTTRLAAQYGEPESIHRIIPASNHDGTVEITYARAILAMRMVLDQDDPHPVIGLQVTGATVSGDSLEKIADDMSALPGIAGFQVAEKSGGTSRILAQVEPDHQFAIGSTFKLYVLAALSRQVKAGQRNWNDVVPLSRKSLPSGVLQNWPDEAPLTLQTLATLMISISDNSATDILIDTIGRKEIAATVRDSGHEAPEKILPFLTTLEVFALKMPTNDDLREHYVNATEPEQYQLLESRKTRLGIETVSIANLATRPRHINQIEWYASPTDINRLLLQIAASKDPVVRKLLAINKIIPPGDALRWQYVGGKGGSEPGVVSFAFLTESKSGKTYAISGSWNNSSAAVQNEKFLLTMNRLLNNCGRNAEAQSADNAATSALTFFCRHCGSGAISQ